jgi:hypothetical protein
MKKWQNASIAVRDRKAVERPASFFDVVREGDASELVHAAV